ncbi:MAG TPA: dienelactone hydrolase family protein [Desulfomonilaceae bacterium]|nr:dienelactone hydrolase family protein [Desulfomonilaceae bacterium]
MKLLLMLVLSVLMPALSFAQVHTQSIDYQQNGTPLEGFVAYKEGLKGKVPGILVVPDWMGLGDHYKSIAAKLAELGYVAFVADIYGKGVKPANSQEAGALAKKYKDDRKLMRDRVKAGLDRLRKFDNVDPNRVAAMGYCFGGTVVLELARSGADILGVVSFHGGLATPTPQDAKNIKAHVLALHGADDPFVPPEEVAAFQQEMRNGHVDWQMVIYGNAVHAFTTPAAGNDKSKGAAYDEKADKRSWEAMKAFFKELF